MTDYTPIEEYGLIGNLETCALVGQDGSIDWCPLPTLESSSTFSSILDVAVAVRPRPTIEPATARLARILGVRLPVSRTASVA